MFSDDLLVVGCAAGAWVAFALLVVPLVEDLDLVEFERSSCVVRDLLFDRFGLTDEDAEESDDTGFGPFKFCFALRGSGGSIAEVRGGRFLFAVGCSSLGAVRGGGGTTGAQEASELMGCFIHVATVEESKSSLFLACLLRCRRTDSPRFDRLLRRASAVEGGMTASKPEEAPSSSLKATHSLLRLLATIVYVYPMRSNRLLHNLRLARRR